MESNERDPAALEERIALLERKLKTAQERADEAWTFSLCAILLAILFKFGALGVLVALAVFIVFAVTKGARRGRAAQAGTPDETVRKPQGRPGEK